MTSVPAWEQEAGRAAEASFSGDKFEGHVEGSAGNNDMWRAQAALAVPLADIFKVRLEIDTPVAGAA